MNVVTTFDSTKERLSDILGSINAGNTRLPDFQRGGVGDAEYIRLLVEARSRALPELIEKAMGRPAGRGDIGGEPAEPVDEGLTDDEDAETET